MNYVACSILENLPNILTSKIAVIVYIGLILASIFVLMILLMIKEGDKKSGEYTIIGDINVASSKKRSDKPQGSRVPCHFSGSKAALANTGLLLISGLQTQDEADYNCYCPQNTGIYEVLHTAQG